MIDVIEERVLDEWRSLLGDRALEFYFTRILPDVVRLLDRSQEHAALRSRGYSVLVSTMGLSPETTVIATSVLRPRRLIIIASERNEAKLQLAMDFLERHDIMKVAAVRVEDVDPTNTKQIYDAIRRHFRAGQDGSPIMDVTGGKKIMSAMAAIVAVELGIPLCYVEGAYDNDRRRPLPGTERVIALRNPSQEHARVLRDRALGWYERGSMPAAIDAFSESREAQTETPQFDELALQLARCESALMDLDLKTLREQVEILGKVMGRPAMETLTHDLSLEPHAQALGRVANGDRMALLATFRQLVTRYCQQGRFDFASLIAYRTLEELVQIGLSRASMKGLFDGSNADLTLLADDVAGIRQRYAALMTKLHHSDSEIPSKITFLAGLVLLGVTTDIAEKLPASRKLVSMLKHAGGLAAMRNHSVLAHGTRNLTEQDVEKLSAFERELAQAILGDDLVAVQKLERELAPPELRRLVR